MGKRDKYKRKQQQKKCPPPRRKRNDSEDSHASQGSTTYTGDNGGRDTSSLPSIWTWKDKNAVIQYLKDYKAGCEMVYFGEDPTDVERRQVTIVGDIAFPPLLSDAVFRQPRLPLPSSLRSKHRKMIHDACAEVNLYHYSWGSANRNERTIAISAYADNGFQDMSSLSSKQNLHNTTTTASQTTTMTTTTTTTGLSSAPIRMYKYKPWYCRKERQGDKTTTEQRQRQAIDALIDQPGDCLRPGLDDLDFSVWGTADLSSTTTQQQPQDPKPQSSLPVMDDSTTWMLVDTAEKMQQCIDELSSAATTAIGFDLELYNRSKYAQLTCLLQLTSNVGRDYIVDTLAPGVWDAVPGLASLFGNPAIVKVGHSIGGLDVRSLHRDFGIFLVNAFDTYEAAKVLGMERKGLAAVCEQYGLSTTGADHARLKKQYQNCDWRQRPLTLPMIQYAVLDVHYLLRLRWLMMRDLTRYDLWDQSPADQRAQEQHIGQAVSSTLALFNQYEDDDEYWDTGGDLGSSRQGVAANDSNQQRDNDLADMAAIDAGANDADSDDERNPIALVEILRLQPELMRVISHSQQRCRDLWSLRRESFINHPMRIRFAQQARRKELVWTRSNETLLGKLVDWCDQVAQELECLPGFVAPMEALLPMALQRPTTDEALRRISIPLPDVLEYEATYRQGLLNVIRESFKADGHDPDDVLIMRHADIGTGRRGRKRKHFPWAMAAALAVGAAGVAVAVVAARRRRRL